MSKRKIRTIDVKSLYFTRPPVLLNEGPERQYAIDKSGDASECRRFLESFYIEGRHYRNAQGYGWKITLSFDQSRIGGTPDREGQFSVDVKRSDSEPDQEKVLRDLLNCFKKFIMRDPGRYLKSELNRPYMYAEIILRRMGLINEEFEVI